MSCPGSSGSGTLDFGLWCGLYVTFSKLSRSINARDLTPQVTVQHRRNGLQLKECETMGYKIEADPRVRHYESLVRPSIFRIYYADTCRRFYPAYFGPAPTLYTVRDLATSFPAVCHVEAVQVVICLEWCITSLFSLQYNV